MSTKCTERLPLLAAVLCLQKCAKDLLAHQDGLDQALKSVDLLPSEREKLLRARSLVSQAAAGQLKTARLLLSEVSKRASARLRVVSG